MTIVFAIYTCSFTGFLTYSMMKLRRFSSLLASDGILASKHLLILHVICFWIASLLEVANMIVTFILDDNLQDKQIPSEATPSDNNLAFAQQWIDIVLTSVFAIIMATMLVMMVKFGTPLSSAEKSQINMRFLLNFNAQDFGRKR